MIKNNEKQVLKAIRNNSREKCSRIAKKLGIKKALIEKIDKNLNKYIHKRTSLIKQNFIFPIRVVFRIKNSKRTEQLLFKDKRVNNLSKTKDSLLVEAFFKNLVEKQFFKENFRAIKEYEIIEELKREELII